MQQIKIEQRFLDLLSHGFSVQEILHSTEINAPNMFHLIRNLQEKGIDLRPNYNTLGEIHYTFDHYIDSNRRRIDVADNQTTLTFGVISDLHIGSVDENLWYLDQFYHFCIRRGIHLVLNGGDLVHDRYDYGVDVASSFYQKNVEHFIRKFPYDQGIVNFICFGNHDFTYEQKGIHLSERLSKSRPDLVRLGYGEGSVLLKNDELILRHKLRGKKFSNRSHNLVLYGHYHETGSKDSDFLAVKLPSLSDIQFRGVPGFLTLSLSFQKNGFFKSAFFEEYSFLRGKLEQTDESSFDLLTGRSLISPPSEPKIIYTKTFDS